MTKEEFLEKLKVTLNTNENLNEKTVLESLAGWDSLAVALVITLFEDEFKISLNYQTIGQAKTVEDLMKMAGI